MKPASQVPSGVLISASVSTTARPTAAADFTVAARPAPTKRVPKSRRVMSPRCASFVGWFFGSFVMDSPATSLSLLIIRPHLRDVCFFELLNGGLLAYRHALMN